MSYDSKLLFERISGCLRGSPSTSLLSLSRSLQVSRQTIGKVIRVSTGGTFKLLRNEILLAQVRLHFAAKPTVSIKEVSFAVGFKSASSFARTIKRAFGFSPADLRSLIARELLAVQSVDRSLEDQVVNRPNWPTETTSSA
jgi:AraC-like DNA-binding protein